MSSPSPTVAPPLQVWICHAAAIRDFKNKRKLNMFEIVDKQLLFRMK